MSRIAALCLAAVSTLPLSAQQPSPFGERVDVNVVLIDAVVTDPQGNQILGLQKEDFIVTENGVEQSIDSVDYFTNRQLLTGREGAAPFQVERVREERYTIFFFDKPVGGGLFDELIRARRAAEEFVEEMGPRDQVAVVGHDSRLKVYSDFTNDKRKLKRALGEAVRFSRGITRPAPGDRILNNIRSSELMDDTGTVYEALTLLGESLRSIPARKILILFSPGIVEPGEEVRGGMLLNTSRYYEPMIHSLNAANVTVYAKNLLDNPSTAPVFHQTLERLTSETNGEYYRQAVSYQPLMKAVDRASAGYYLIAYRRPARSSSERGFQQVQVRVRNPEFRVRARAGYPYGD